MTIPTVPAIESRGRGADLSDVLLVVPTLNEQAGLAVVLRQASQLSVATLVIDGGSADRSVEVALEAGVEVRRVPRGKGRAWREFQASISPDSPTYIAMIDADASYDLAALPRLIDSGADMVVALRDRLPGSTALHRLAGSTALTLAASLITMRRCPDILSGFRIMRSDCLREIQLTSDGFGLEAELTIEFLRRGFSVDWVPAGYQPRYGDSKLRPLQDGMDILGTMLKTRFRPL